MTAHAAEFFTLDEVNRLKIIQDVIDRRLTTQMTAQRLGISDRQCRRLLSRYRESGPLGMANRRRGKPSNNQLPDGLALQPIILLMSLRLVSTGALRKRPGMTLMFTGHLKLTMTWQRFSHDGNRAVFQNP